MRSARSGKLPWMAQALSGLALVALLGLHFAAQHYVAQGGLRTYADVQAYLTSPVIWALEALFLVVVAVHAALGLRAVALDLGLSPRRAALVNAGVTALAALAIGYGLWLLIRVGGK